MGWVRRMFGRLHSTLSVGEPTVTDGELDATLRDLRRLGSELRATSSKFEERVQKLKEPKRE